MKVLETLSPSKQFLLWLTVSVPAFVVCSGAAELLSLSPAVAFVGGTVFSTAMDPICDWFQDWKEVEQQVERFRPGGDAS